MMTARAVIRSAVGLHARPAADFVREAERYRSKVRLSKDGVWVNGKSILAILTLAAESGSELVIEVSGVDEKEALVALKAKIEQYDT